MIAVQYQRGVYLPEQDLWLDPADAKPLAFVSHAHSDHIAAHTEIIVSERTSRLMQTRLPGERHEHVVQFGQPATVCGLEFFGVDKVVFASDCPFDPEGGPQYIRETIKIIDGLDISKADREKIYFRNIEKLTGKTFVKA